MRLLQQVYNNARHYGNMYSVPHVAILVAFFGGRAS